ncbi:MAG: DUF4956 domain-containing protein [Planctomycetes bacterium]|nr:DUF4956 domain-containing protein [Planctomycetota bacterium]MCB9920322.1 DUF4956 domain-containing protein [Planctomycetota bacterium]
MLQSPFDSLLDYRDVEGLDVEALVLTVLSSAVLGQVVAWVYGRVQRGPTYSPVLAQSLVVLCMVIALVMLAIGNSLARAFGLFGALALIRFRTPVKDTRDTVFLFYAVVIGILVGAQSFLAAALGTVLVGLVILWLSLSAFGEVRGTDGLLRFRCPAGSPGEQEVLAVLKRFCRTVGLLHMRGEGDSSEYAYEIGLRNPASTSKLLTEVRAIDDVSNVSFLSQREDLAP